MGVAVAAIGLVAVITIVIVYNGLVRTRLRVREGWSAIDVQLQRRASLIPNLVESVQGYAAYERGTLTQIVEARGALRTRRRSRRRRPREREFDRRAWDVLRRC